MKLNSTHMNKWIVTLYLAIISLSSCSVPAKKVKSYIGFDISTEEIDKHLLLQMEQLNIPGLAIAFINDGKVVYHNTYGYANTENGKRVTSETIFEGASISKPVFAYFVMTFVDEGKLELDKPLYEYLPYTDIEHDTRYKTITARMVLSHRTGFPNWREDEPDNTLNIKFDPGTEYHYSGEGFQYLALVLKEITNTDWSGLEQLFQERVAKPLGMEHTVFIQNSYTRNHKAEPYDENGKWFDWPNDYWFKKSDSLFVAAATIHSEPIDFAKWMVHLMHEKSLSSDSYSQLFKPHSLVEKTSAYDVNYTLGFFQLDMPFTDVYFHGGNNQGFTSWFAFDKSKKWGYVLFTNSEKGEQLGGDLLFYLLAGPNEVKLYTLIGLIVLSILAAVVFTLKLVLSVVKRNLKNR